MSSSHSEPARAIAPRATRIKRSGRGVAAILALSLSLAGSPAMADRYNSRASGNPVRIAAYVVHPFGVALDYLILRPAHWLFSKEPLKTLVGHKG